MAKYVYPNTNQETFKINFKDYPQAVCLKSYLGGYIIANDNKLEGR